MDPRQAAHEEGLASRGKVDEVEADVRRAMYTAVYDDGPTTGEVRVPRPSSVLEDPSENRGTAYTAEARRALGVVGLLPPKVFTMEEQAALVMQQFGQVQRPLDRYSFLMALQVRWSGVRSGSRCGSVTLGGPGGRGATRRSSIGW